MTRLSEKAAKGTSSLVSQSMVTGLLRILSIMILARLLLQSEMGQIALLGVIYGVTQFLGALGLNHASPLYLGKAEEEGDFSIVRSFLNKSVLLIMGASVTIAIILLAFLPQIITSGFLTYDLVLFASLLIPLSSLDVFLDSFLLGRYKVRLLVASRMAFEGARFFFSILLVLLGMGVFGVLVGWIIGEGIGVIVFSAASRFNLPPYKGSIRMLPVLGFALPSLVFQTIDVTIQNADRLILLTLTGLETLGVYDVLLSLLFLMSFFSLSVSTSLYPILTRIRYSSDSLENQQQDSAAATGLLVRYILLFLLPVSVFLAMHAELILAILVGNSYSTYINASLSFAILSLAYLLWAITYSLHSVLRSAGEKRFFVYVGIFVITFEIVGCWILTSVMGLLGATIIRAIYIGVLFITAVIAVQRSSPLERTPLLRSTAKIAFSSVLCSVCFFFFPPIDLISLVLRIILLSFLYIGMLFVTKEITKFDFTLAAMLFPDSINTFIRRLERAYLKDIAEN
jgi:O-antigen/teichoic acid export membrane protein